MAPFQYGREQPNVHQLPEIGYLRLPQIIGDPNADPPIPAVIPVGKSTWWEGVKSGRFPRPVKLGPRITAWRVEDIRALIQELLCEVRHEG
jgi:predicted DNA-binding transcriptional regulator AlpA